MTIVNKGRLLKTGGWIIVGVGFYMIMLGNSYDGNETQPKTSDPNILDADFTIIE